MYAFVLLKNGTGDNNPMNMSDSASLAVTMGWKSGNASLGSLNNGIINGHRYWDLHAETSGTSLISWTIRCRHPDTDVDYWANRTTNVTVGNAELDHIQVSPSDVTTLKNKKITFTVEAYLTDDTEVTASYSWVLDNPSLGTLSQTSGIRTNLTAGNAEVSGHLICHGTYKGKTVNYSASISVILKLPDPETHTRIYDLFNVPLQPYWADRYQEQVLSWTFPVAYSWLGASPAGDDWVYSDYRINVSAKNISKANTIDNPVYVPVTNPDPGIRGGNIQLDWIAGYIDGNEVKASGYSEAVSMYYDSWFFRTNGTITMDRLAAKMVLNITDTELDNFATWKSQKWPNFEYKLSNFFLTSMNIKTPIIWAYSVDGSIASEKYDIDKVGDKVVLKLVDLLSWGFESLLGRWWKSTFMSFEGWPDQVHFTANIGPSWSDFNLDACMQYSLESPRS
jgi:hypothetical protein